MGIVFGAKVTPRASSDEIQGWTSSAPAELLVRVSAAPADGKANKAVCSLIASSLGIAKGRVSVKRGQASRHKQIEVDVDQAAFDAWAASL